MPLPWPFRRSANPTSDRSSPAPQGAASPPPPMREWASLPSIQRTIGDPPLVAPAAPFLARVPGAVPLPAIVGSLGHDLSWTAPAGLVAAPLHPVAALTSDAALVRVPSRVQRLSDGRSDSEAPTTSGPSPTPEGIAPSWTPAELRHQLGVVPAGTAANAPERPLTRVDTIPVAVATPPTAGPARPVQAAHSKPVVARTVDAPPAPASPNPLTMGRRLRRVALGAPLDAAPSSAVPLTEVGDDRAGASRVAFPSSSSVAQRSLAPRLLGIDAVARESPIDRPSPTIAGSAPLPPTVQRRSGGIGMRRTSPDTDVGRQTTGQAIVVAPSKPRLPTLEVVRPRSNAGLGPNEPPTGHHDRESPQRPTAEAAVQRDSAMSAIPGSMALATRSRPGRPLVGSQPTITVGTTQRSAARGPSEASPAEGNAPTSWIESRTAGGLPAAPALADGQWSGASIRRPERGESAGRPSGPPTNAIRPPLGVQRSAAHVAPDKQQRPDLDLLKAPATPAPATTRSSLTAVGAENRAFSADFATVQASTTTAAPAFAATATAIVQRIDGAAPPAPIEASGHSERELDELAGKLFRRFQNRLRAEVIYEREAKGLAFDD